MPLNNALWSPQRGQEIDERAKHATLANALNVAKGQGAAFAGLPGDLGELARALINARSGYQVVSDEPSRFGTEALGQMMGADTDSGAFLAGNIGVPDLTDAVKLMPLLALKGVNKANKVLGPVADKGLETQPASVFRTGDSGYMTVLGEGGDTPYVGKMYVGEGERRQGKNISMIESAGEHYAGQGKKLQSGQLTNDAAVGVWEKLVKEGRAENLGGNKFQYVPKLPLDEASRMARAREMGFDTDAYHGTNKDVDEFIPKKTGGNLQMNLKGVHRAVKPEFAGRYADDIGGNVMPLKLRSENMLKADELVKEGTKEADIVKDLLKGTGREPYWSSNNMDGSGPKFGPPLQNIIDSVSTKKAEKILDKYGIDTVRYNAKFGTQEIGGMMVSDESLSYLSRNPKNIRSVNAKFDPSKKDSANLLAGVGGATLLTAMMANEQGQ